MPVPNGIANGRPVAMAAHPRSTPSARAAASGQGWIDLATAAQRSGLSASHLMKLCRGSWQALGLAKRAELVFGRKRTWLVHESADSRLEPNAPQVRAKLLEALERGQRSADGKPIDANELRRRSRLLAALATPTAYGRRLCLFCGKEHRGAFLARHLERQHRQAIEQMPMEAFN